jgi:hypothetical protein
MFPAVASFGLGLASAGASWWLGEQQAKQQRADTDEQVRRFKLQHASVTGEATARGAASGFEADSQGLLTYLANMQAEFGRQEDWMHTAGYRRAAATSDAAKLGFLTGGAGSFNTFAQANNWWQTPAGAQP